MKRILALLVAAIFLVSSTPNTLAKGFSGGGHSSGGHSSSFGGGSRSSPSVPSGGLSPRSYSGSSPSTSSSGRTYGGGPVESPKASGGLKSEVSVPKAAPSPSPSAQKPSFDKGGAAAKQHEQSAINFSDWKAKNPTPSTRPPRSFEPSLAQTREQRTQTTFASRQPTGYYTPSPGPTIVYRDHYDNSFMQTVTMLWLFHHWDGVDKSRFEESRLRELEAKIRAMEAQGMKRDSNYVEAGVDPDLQYRKDTAYGGTRGEGSNGGSIILYAALTILIVCVLAWLGWFIFIRRVTH